MLPELYSRRSAGLRWLAAVCGLVCAALPAHGQPQIVITSMPVYGTGGFLQGQVYGLNPNAYRVALLLNVTGFGWYSKPFCASPTQATLAPIGPDGSWNGSVTSGGVDDTATQYAAFVVPASATVACYQAADGIPAVLKAQSVAGTVVNRPPPRQITFAGRVWDVKTNRVPVSPGPCLFSDSTDNVFVDALGRLHLKVTNVAGQWRCAEVVSRAAPGYGVFSWSLASPVNTLDPNLVLGLFTWSDADGAYAHREMDIEFTKSGQPADPNLEQFVLQPYWQPGHIVRFPFPGDASSTHTFQWTPGQVSFSSLGAAGNLIQQWTTITDVPPAGDQNVRMNLWTFGGRPPAAETEVIISGFRHTATRSVIWQEPISGASQLWTLGGAQGITVVGAANVSGPNPWRIAALADFNLDGQPDVIWQDPVTGTSQLWLLSGGTVTAAAPLSGAAGDWIIAGAADFNGDTHPDLIWQNTQTGQSQVWLLGGAQGATLLGALPLSGFNTWRIAAAADFDGDGHPDLVWQDPISGASQVWFLGGPAGVQILNAAPLSAANSWRIAAAADFNNDGHPDLLWQDPFFGASQVWFLGGPQGTALIGAAGFTGTHPWRVVGPR